MFENKIFPIKFSKVVLSLSIASFVLYAVGIGLSIYNIVQFGIANIGDALKYPFLIVICVVFTVFVSATLKSSYYEITQEKLVAKYGFLKSEYPVSQITALVLDRDENKLVAYMGDVFMTITIDKSQNEQFIRAMLNANGDIDFSYTITENTPPKTE